MRVWGAILIAVGVAGWFVLTNLGAAMALADLGARPVVALLRDGGAVRVAVQAPGRPALAGEARVLGGEGVLFGYRLRFAMPGEAVVACTIRFRGLSCADGWEAERPPMP